MFCLTIITDEKWNLDNIIDAVPLAKNINTCTNDDYIIVIWVLSLITGIQC